MRKILLFLLFMFSLLEIKSFANSENGNSFLSSFIADTVFYENFENGFSEWTAENINNPQSPSLWRLNNSRYISPVHSVSWNDSLTNSYPHLSYEALISPPLDIPSNAKVILSFDVFIHLTPEGTSSNDNFDIHITTDNGSTWSDFSNYAYSGQQIGWKNFPADFAPNETGDLTSFAGKTIKIRFVITTDNISPNGEGVYIDNFRVVKTDCETTDIFEPNNSDAQATPVQHSQQIDAALCPLGDVDFYSFQVSQNDKINIMAQYNIYQITLSLFSPSGTQVASTGNKNLNYNAQVNGTYYLKVSLPDFLNYTPDYNLYVNIINTKPDVMSVSDIEGDQGFKVRLQWQHSLFDPPDSVSTIQQYYIFRKVNDTLNLQNKAVPLNEIKLTDIIPGTIFFELDEYWDYITSVPAVSPRPFNDYNYTAPTLHNNIESTFRIAAVSKNSTQPVLWGLPGSGISLDNVQPQFISTSVYSGSGGIVLDWETDANTSPDVMNIKIYKGMFERFAPAQNHTIAILPPGITSYTDPQNTPIECFYIISLNDFSGNETYSAPLKGIILTADKEKLKPEEFILKQNYPNPFNPETYIEFSIPEDALVNLKIYDILGREVSEVINDYYSAGPHKISFSASELSSGTYFYSLKAGDHSVTRKLTVLK